MQWFEIAIQTNSEAIDYLGAKLTSIGYDSFIVDDSDDFQTFLDENTKYWDYVDDSLAQKMSHISQIRLYIQADATASDQLSVLKDELEVFRNNCPVPAGSLEVKIESLAEEDWENSWKEYYQPIEIGNRILIVPEWLTPDNPNNRIPIRLDPGMIFGTGAHASTQMCLAALEDRMTGGEAVIDLGSGSGILSIAALQLGAKSAIGVDIDEKAEDIAYDNAALNGLCAPTFRAVTGNVIGDSSVLDALQLPEGYDIVLANIVADVIIPLTEVVPKLIKPNGYFICSGVLNTRLSEVEAAIASHGLRVIDCTQKNDWCCITAQINGDKNDLS